MKILITRDLGRLNLFAIMNRFFESKIGGCLQGDLNKLLPLQDISPLYVKEMDMNNSKDIAEWLDIINDAYGINWSVKNYFDNVLNNPYLIITNTYLLKDKGKAIGTISIGVHRKNKNVGTDFRIGVKKIKKGQDFGKYIILYGLHKLKEQGISQCESNILLMRKKSFYIHLNYGFLPKYKMDYWNINTVSQCMSRIIINYKMRNIYRDWIKYCNN